jgi:hypothetical protein
MRPAVLLLALLPLAACAPPGYQYDGFTLRSDAQEQAYNQAKVMRWQDQLDERVTKSGWVPNNRPTTGTPDEWYASQDMLYNSRLQNWIDYGGSPPEPPPVRP